MMILAVDDDEVSLEILRHCLAEAGHEVRTASNGRQAMDILRENPCPIVITDWEMPEISGLELCRAIRAEQFPRYVYTIVLTIHARQEDRVAGLSAGADDYISKPFSPAELLMRVKVAQRVLALETRDLTIFALAKLAESRDPETGQHLERVRNYCRMLVECLGRDGPAEYRKGPSFAMMIYQTSPLHDIGKIGIPDTVLLKPASLSDAEFEIMKNHTTIGAAALSAALEKFPEAGFLRMAKDIALTHHERFDGTGYPQGLVGHNIPLSGRIVALADAYDAMTSRRVYKKEALGHEVAKGIILEESGSHFDPEIVAAFLNGEHNFLRIREQLGDHVTVTV